MSQQEMHSEEISSHEPYTSYRGYESVFSQDENFSDLDRQKLPPRSKKKDTIITSRIFLAIMSLLLWLVAFFIVIVTISSRYISSSPSARLVHVLLILGLLFFTGLVIIINYWVNRLINHLSQ